MRKSKGRSLRTHGPSRHTSVRTVVRPYADGRTDDGTVVLLDTGRRSRRGAAALRTGRRAGWKFRRQLAPLVVICLLWAAGAIVHHAAHGAWLVLVLGVLAVAGAWLFSRRWLDRAIEQAYAAGCLAAAAAWLAAAATVGVGKPMPALLWGGGSLLALPWWRHHRLRLSPRLDVDTSLEDVWAERVAAPGKVLPGSRLSGIETTRNGWTATIRLAPGERSTNDAIAATPKIASAFEKPAPSVVIEPTADGVASHARLLVLRRNPLADIQAWTGPSLDPATGLAPVGAYADGGTTLFRFYTPGSGVAHTLVAGAPGSGKSRFLDLLLAEASHSGLVVPWLIDPQHGQSLPRWVDHVDWAALDHHAALRMLRTAQRIMHARSRHLARVEWTDEAGRTLRGKESFDPSPELPLLLLVIDEAHEILKDDKAVAIIEDIGKMGRKTGVGVVLVTQLPSITELGGSMTIRSMVSSGNVVVFRTADRVTSGMAFSGALPVDPSALPREFPGGKPTSGLGYVLGPSARPTPMRAYLVEDPYHWAATAPALPLDPASVEAAGEECATRHDPTASEPAEESLRPRRRSVADAVLDALTGGEEVTRDEIIAASGKSPRAVDYALIALVDAGRVVRTAHGRYQIGPDA
ncbi:MAG: hypothetical protein ACRDN9_14370 [Streptosporangiaceae bacterium]